MASGKVKKQQPKHTTNCTKDYEILRVKRRVNQGSPFSHWGILLKCSGCGRLGKNPVKKQKSEH